MSGAQRTHLQELIKCDVDWNYIVTAAIKNRVSSFLYLNLKTLSEDVMPRHILSKLRTIHLQTIALNLRISQELVGILRVFEKKAIPIMLLKGAALEYILERSIQARSKIDIDILLHERDLYNARSALSELGYTITKSLPNMTERELVQYAHCFDQIKSFKKGGYKIDVHFRLLNMGMPTIEENLVWSRSRYVCMDENCALVPSPEDMLLHLCFHANHHGFTSLYYFCDIHDLIDHFNGEIDWEYFAQAARERKIQATIYYALLITDRLLGSSVPLAVYERLRPNRLKRIVFEFIWLKGRNHRGRRLNLGSFEGPFYYLLEMDGLRPKIAFMWKLLFPPLNWLSHHYRRSKSIALRYRYLKDLLTRYRRTVR